MAALMMDALDAGAEDMDVQDDVFEVTTSPADFSAVREALGLSENFHITMLLPVGYLREDAKPAHLHCKRREISEMAHEV